MERTSDTAVKIESSAPQGALLVATFRAANGWWLFCILVFAIKLLLLWLDPRPKLFMGDSWTYVQTALTGYGTLRDNQIEMLTAKFGLQAAKHLPVQPFSLLQRYFLGAWPYYFVVVVSPLVCAFAICLSRDIALEPYVSADDASSSYWSTHAKRRTPIEIFEVIRCG